MYCNPHKNVRQEDDNADPSNNQQQRQQMQRRRRRQVFQSVLFVKGIKIPGNTSLWTCLHGGGGPQVGEVTWLGGVARLTI